MDIRTPPIITNLSFPPRIQHRVNSDGSPVLLGPSGFPASSAGQALLEFIPMKIGAGMTFLEAAINY
jgi:hypothetical protein